MLDINFIRKNIDLIKQNVKDRFVDLDIDRLLDVDKKRRGIIVKLEDKRASRNKGSKSKPTPEEIEELKRVGLEIKGLETELELVDVDYFDLYKRVPNLIHPKTPRGGEEDFKVLEIKGEKPNFSFDAKNHDELMENLNMIDFERGAKIAGSKWYFLKNDAVLLERALISYGLEILQDYNFDLMITPDLAKTEILEGAGFNPRGEEDQIYKIENEELNLIGTAEIPLAGYHANETIDLSNGPIKYAGLSHCFRKEAGAYGRTSKGIYRVHQFTKLEMFVFCKPEESEKIHQELLEMEQKICDGLEIPYRVIDIPTGDLGAPAYRKYDIEAYMNMVGENGGYGEITSASNCTDYQARRLNIKYKKEDGSTEFVHTLNGTAIVASRFPIAILENLQQEDGSILIPKVLQKYIGKEKIERK
ncbi:MAG: serine--tRNA ligase [Candidatus Magasanikbacteria bacterium]|nr:serine--tRNA ligase [Candidatus Magasanikbacteria bacterium]